MNGRRPVPARLLILLRGTAGILLKMETSEMGARMQTETQFDARGLLVLVTAQS
jgi:hypothetical protein